MNDIDLNIINKENYCEYKDILSIAFDFNFDILKETQLGNDFLTIDKADIYKWLNDFDKEFLYKSRPDKIIIINGSLGKALIDDLPIKGFTLLIDDLVYIFIAMYNDKDLLRRVLLHEWTHGVRIKTNNIKSYKEYLNYLSDIENIIYEEILAISVEKYFNEALDWEVISNMDYNCAWELWNSEKKYKKLFQDDFLNSIESLSMVYYFAYHICKRVMTPSLLKDLLLEDSSVGIKKLLTYVNINKSGEFSHE